MAGNDVSITIGVDNKGAITGLKEVGDQAEKSTGTIGKMGGALADMAKIAGGIMLAKGFEELGGAIKGAFSDAIEYQKMQAQTEAVIKSTGGAAGMTAKEVVKLANSLESVTAIDDQVIQGAENMLMTFTNIGKDVFPQATEAVLNMSVALGQDAQQSAVQLGKALNDPIAGVTALQRVGVKLTESQKKLIKSLVAVGDVAGAQKVILKELDTEFGNSARAAGSTLGGQLRNLQDTIQDTFRDLAVKALPTLLEFAKIAAELLPKAIDFTVTKLGELADAVAPLATKAAELAGVGWDKISGPLGTIASLPMDGLKALVGLFGELKHLFDLGLGGGSIGGEWSNLEKAAFTLGETLRPLLATVGELAHLFSVGLGGGQIGGEWSTLETIAFKLGQTLQGLPGLFAAFAEQLANAGSSIRGMGLPDFAAGWARVTAALQPAIDILRPLVEKILADLRKQFDEVKTALAPLGKSFADLGAALSPLMPLLEPLGKILGTVIVVAIAALLVQLDLFVKFMTVTLVGAINVATLAIKGITVALEFVTSKVQAWAPEIGHAFYSVWQTVSANVDLIVERLEGMVSGAWDIGSRFVNGLWGGMQSAWGSVEGWIRDKLDPRNWDIPGLSPLPDAMEHGGAIGGARFIGGISAVLNDGWDYTITPILAKVSAGIKAVAAEMGGLNSSGNVGGPGGFGGAAGGSSFAAPKPDASGNIPGIQGYDVVQNADGSYKYVAHSYGGSAPGVSYVDPNSPTGFGMDSQSNHPGQYWNGSTWVSTNVNNATTNPTYEQATSQSGWGIDPTTGLMIARPSVNVNFYGNVNGPGEVVSSIQSLGLAY